MIENWWRNLALMGTSAVASESPGIFLDIGLQSFLCFVKAVGVTSDFGFTVRGEPDWAALFDRKSC